jgi:phosphoglycolate phosphatase
MKIFFDLDGTLVNSKPRLYELFKHLVPTTNYTFDEYWELKKSKVNHSQILTDRLQFGIHDIKLFQARWMKLIEAEEWLIYDYPFAGVTNYLNSLNQKGHELYIVTARQSVSKANEQIEKFGWIDLLQDVLVTKQTTSKVELMKPIISDSSKTWMIGDTGNDILSGKELNLNTVAVLTGFLSAEVLKTYKPDRIIERVINLDFKDTNGY